MNTILLTAVLSQFTIPNSDLSRNILREYPELREARTDFQRVGIIRCYAWGRTDMIHSAPGEPRDNPVDVAERQSFYWHVQSAERFYSHFDHNEGGVLPCDAALGLMKLYRHFGYRSWKIETNGPVPWQVVVEIQHKGKTLYALECPTLNLEFIDRATLEPICYFEMLKRLGRREAGSIRPTGPDYTQVAQWPRLYLPKDRNTSQAKLWCVQDGLYDVETLRDGDLCYHSPRTIESFVRKRLFDYETGERTGILKITQAGYPADWLYQNLMFKGAYVVAEDREMSRAVWDAIGVGEGEWLER